MIRGSALSGLLERDPSAWFDPSGDWTVTRWFRLDDAVPGPGFLTLWLYGDTDYTTIPYIYLGTSVAGTSDVLLEVFDGVTYFDTTTYTLDTDPHCFEIRYQASSTTIELLVDEVSIGSLVVDLASLGIPTRERLLNDSGAADVLSVGFSKLWSAYLTVDELVADRFSLIPVKTTNLLSYTPLEVTTVLTDQQGHDWTSSGTVINAVPFNTTCARAAVVAQLPYQQLQQVCGATELWSTYLSGVNGDFSVGVILDAGTQTFTLNDGSCSGMNVLFTGLSGTHAFRATAGTQYWLQSASLAGATELVHTWTVLDPFEHISTPMTWTPDLANGVTVTVAGSWSTGGTKVELIAATTEDLLLCAVLARPSAVGSSAQLQFDFWAGATGATALGSVSVTEQGSAGDGFGPATLELGVPLLIPAGSRVMVSGSKGSAGTASWVVSIGTIPAAVTGSITSTSHVLKVAPDHADGIALQPADLVGTPGAWLELIAASGGDVVIQHIQARWPNLMSKSDYTIEIGIGGMGAETTVDTYKGGSSDTAISTEGMPMSLYHLVPATGLIPLGSRVSARLSTINSAGGANTNAWSVHITYYES